MLIALVLLVAAWLVLNIGLLGAVAVANHTGQRKAAQIASAPRVAVAARGQVLSAR